MMCQTDNRVLEQQQRQKQRQRQQQQQQSTARPTVGSARRKPSGGYSSRTSSTAMSTDTNSGSTGSKSCLVVPGFGKNSRRSGKRLAGSAASTTDQSSTAENIFNPTAHNDRQSLLLKSSNQLTADWFKDSVDTGTGNGNDQTGNASTLNQRSQMTRPQQQQFQQQQQQYQQPPLVTPTSQQQQQNPAPAAASLLSFPVPSDRSHVARRQQNQKQGVKHAYDGEMEPDGIRGQEARVRNGQRQQESAPNIPIRDFQGNLTSRSRARPQSQSRPYHSRSSASTSSTPSAPESRSAFQEEQKQQIEPPSNFAQNSARQYLPTSYKQPPRRGTHALQRQMSDNASTTSSQDIESLMQSEFSENQQQEQGFEANFSGKEPPASLLGAFKPQEAAFPPVQTQPKQAAWRPEPPASPPRSSRKPPRSPGRNRSRDDSLSYSSYGLDASSQGSNKSWRRSAPVNVDDASFEAPQQNVQGIHAMAMEHVQQGEFDMALQAFAQVLEVYLQKYGPSHPMTASAYHNLGTVHSKRAALLMDHSLHQRHCREQALICFQSAARSARDAPQLGPSHPNVAVSLVRIGFLLLQSRQYQNAVLTFQEALRIRLKHYGPNNALVANLYNNLGVCHMHLQDFVVGRQYLRQALDIQRVLLEEDEFSSTALIELADTLCNLGGLCIEWIRQQGPDARHALDAETAFLEAIEIRVKVLGDDHALTNQARSLHDMIRNIPLPKVSPRGQSSPVSRSGSRPGTNRSPRGVSFQETSPSTSTFASTPNQAISPASGGSRTPDALNMPSLQQQSRSKPPRGALPQEPPKGRARQDPPVISQTRLKHSPSREDVQTTIQRAKLEEEAYSNELSEAELRSYEVMEENCLLGTAPIVGQLGIVSFSQSAINTADYQKDRLGYMKEAKAILNAHDEYLDSPQLALSKFENHGAANKPDRFRSHKYASEDGLTPLGGKWPKPTEDRISPEVLRDPESHLRTIHQCAADFFQRGRYDEALHLLEIVVEVQRAKNGPLHKDVGSALHNTGLVQLRLSEPYKALQAFEEAVRIRKGSLGRDHAHVAASLVKVGISLMILDRLEDALWIFRESLTVRKQALGPLHPSTARIYNNIGCVHVEFNEVNEAKRAFDAALDIQRNALVNDPESEPVLFGAATTLQNIAYLYRSREVYEQEAVVTREALSLLEQVFGRSHASVLKVLENLADACAAAGQGGHALKYFTEYLERLYERGESAYEKQAAIHFKMSKIHRTQKDLEPQLQKLHLAVKILRSAELSAVGKDLEHEIQVDLRRARQALEMEELNYV